MVLIKRTLLFVLLFVSLSFADTIDVSKRITQDFLLDLASVNNFVAAELYLDQFNEDLSSFDFSDYITNIKKFKPASAPDIDIVILQADQHIFHAEKTRFLLILYYKKEKYLIMDDSLTNKLDFSDFSDDIDLNQFLKKYMGSKAVK
jgi:hypothetical protein